MYGLSAELKAAAMKFAGMHKVAEFRASKGWLFQCKSQLGIFNNKSWFSFGYFQGGNTGISPDIARLEEKRRP